MALTQHQSKCQFCGKLAIEVSRKTMGKNIFIKLQCGHNLTRRALVLDEISTPASVTPIPVETVIEQVIAPIPPDFTEAYPEELETDKRIEQSVQNYQRAKRERKRIARLELSAKAISAGQATAIETSPEQHSAKAISRGFLYWSKFPRYVKPKTAQELALEREEAIISAITNISHDGKELFNFQKRTVRFAELADCNCLILHEQGLGKTPIACTILKRHKELLPALIVVPSGIRIQWFAEAFRWSGLMAQVIEKASDKPEKGVKVVLVSVDTLRLLRPDSHVVTEAELYEAEKAGGTALARLQDKYKARWSDEICAQFKLVIIDESHKIKNPQAARTQAIRKITDARKKVLGNENAARIICMSGTNIEKHAGEFFVTLNLVRPEMFPVQTKFEMQHVQTDEYGKRHGLKYPDRFREQTKDFIIRYKREEVLPDLPRVFRQFKLAEIEGDLLEQYMRIVKEFQGRMDDMEEGKRPFIPRDILGYMARMRRITGAAKVDEAVEFMEEFLLSSDRKIVIFLHHKETAAALMDKLGLLVKYGTAHPARNKAGIITEDVIDVYNEPLQMHSGLSMELRDQVLQEFKKEGNRILVASTKIAGTGLNMQFCSDCLVMEREWNPSDEEQAEGRFPRPGSTADKINAVYLIAAGTIDDFLTDIVETKRQAVAQTLDGKVGADWSRDNLIVELSQALHTLGLKRWRL